MAGLLSGLFNFDNSSPRPNRLGTIAATLADIGAGVDGRQGGALAANRANFEQQQAQLQSQERRQQLMGIAQQLNLEPREMLTFLVNPEEWAKSNASRFGAANVSGGESRVFGDPNAGGSAYTAPKVGMDGGFGYTQTPQGVEITGQRPQSIAEGTDIQQLLEAIRHNKASESLGFGNLGVRQQQANKPAAAKGGALVVPKGWH